MVWLNAVWCCADSGDSDVFCSYYSTLLKKALYLHPNVRTYENTRLFDISLSILLYDNCLGTTRDHYAARGYHTAGRLSDAYCIGRDVLPMVTCYRSLGDR